MFLYNASQDSLMYAPWKTVLLDDFDVPQYVYLVTIFCSLQ